MWKRLLILAGVVLIVAGIVVAVYYQQRNAIGQGYDIKCIQDRQPTSAATSLICVIRSKQNTEQGHASSRWWNVLLAWPEGITAWLLMLTLGAIVWQAWETRKAAAAAADSANAAYGSVTFAEAQLRLMIDKERARLDLNVERTSLEVEVDGEHLHLIATISVRNIGASKAFIRRTSGTLIAKLRNESLDSEGYSPLGLPEQFIDPDKAFVPIKVYCFPTAATTTFAECLEEGTFSLHFFGFIEYETLGLCRRKEFGYDWNILDRNSGLGGLYGLSDPYPNSPRPARDRITYGYWQPNEERDKPEYPISCEREAAGQ
jgi:hypothetical protein